MMRSILGKVIVVVAMIFASASAPSAGVVMSETAAATGPEGDRTQNRIVYVQGNKQKVKGPSMDAITDLDKGVLYLIDNRQRKYVELSLEPPADAGSQIETIPLGRTKRTEVIANYRCKEYRGVRSSQLEQLTISTCISSSAPGANEVAAFERRMFSRLYGTKPESSGANSSAGLILEKQSLVRIRIPDPSQGHAYRILSMSAKTRIDNIEVKRLPADTFVPPKGFSELRNQPGENRNSELIRSL